MAGLFGLGSTEHTMFSDSDPPPSVDLTFDAHSVSKDRSSSFISLWFCDINKFLINIICYT